MTRGRPRQFDRKQVLEKAMLTFWRNGYRGTSLDDLTETMGINRPSLYSAFGDKEALFIEAVDHYRDNFVAPPVRRLLSAAHLGPGLSGFFADMGAIVVDNETPPGCFIACLLSEECCESDVIKVKLAALIAAADSTFTSVFEQHKRELKTGLTAHAAAQLLTSTVHGLSIRARCGASVADLQPIGAAFIEAVVQPMP